MRKKVAVWTILPSILLGLANPVQATQDDKVKTQLSWVVDILLRNTREAAIQLATSTAQNVYRNQDQVQHPDFGFGVQLRMALLGSQRNFFDHLPHLMQIYVTQLIGSRVDQLTSLIAVSGIKRHPPLVDLENVFLGLILSSPRQSELQTELQSLALLAIRDISPETPSALVDEMLTAIAKVSIDKALLSGLHELDFVLDNIALVPLESDANPLLDFKEMMIAVAKTQSDRRLLSAIAKSGIDEIARNSPTPTGNTWKVFKKLLEIPKYSDAPKIFNGFWREIVDFDWEGSLDQLPPQNCKFQLVVQKLLPSGSSQRSESVQVEAVTNGPANKRFEPLSPSQSQSNLNPGSEQRGWVCSVQ